MTRTPAKKKERLFYLDFVRAFATILIVITHFNNPYLADGRYLITNQPFGIYLGNLGVSLFLIVSGAALTVTYNRPINLKLFYWKRFKGIYPMFWLAWLLATLYFFLDNGGVPINGGPIWSFIYTVFCVDGLVATFGFPTTYLLGEWFLGFILIFYIIYPLLLWAIDKYPVITAVLLLITYSAVLWWLQDKGLPNSIILLVRLPELAFGVYFVKYVKKVPWWIIGPAGVVLILSSMRPEIHEDVATTFVGICSFLILVIVGRNIAIQPVKTMTALVAKYSYPIFLVHHVIIMQLYAKTDWQSFQTVQIYLLFAAACVLTFVTAVLLKHATDQTVEFVKKSFSGASIRPQVSSLEP